MKISSIIDIIEAKLLNQPAITSIKNIHFDISKIKQGDMLIANNLSIEEIIEAVSYGAYAIVFESDNINFDEIDSEIAWIKTDSIKESTIKLLRYALSNIHFNSYYVSDIQMKYLQCLSVYTKELIFLNGNLAEDFEKLKFVKRGYFLFGSDNQFMTKIYPMTSSFKFTLPKITNFIRHSLFSVSFTLKDKKFSHIKVPEIYLNEFISSYIFLNNNDFFKDLNGLKKFDYFKPIYINKKHQIVNYGNSNKTLILQKNSTMLQEELSYIFKNLKYAKIIIILPLYFKSKFDYEDGFYYDNIDEIGSILKYEPFDFAYIFTKDYNFLDNIFYLQNNQNSLFD